MSGKWFVQGVRDDLTKMVTASAKTRGITVGRLVDDALRAHLQTTGGQAAPADAPEVQDLGAISDRVRKIERLLVKLCGPETVPSSGSRIPSDTVERIIALAESGMRAPDIVSAVKASRASVYRILAARRLPAEPMNHPGVRTAQQRA